MRQNLKVEFQNKLDIALMLLKMQNDNDTCASLDTSRTTNGIVACTCP